MLGSTVTTTVWSRAVKKTALHAASIASKAADLLMPRGVLVIAIAGVLLGAWLRIVLTPLLWRGRRYWSNLRGSNRYLLVEFRELECARGLRCISLSRNALN